MSHKTSQVCKLWLSWNVNLTMELTIKVEIEGWWLLLENPGWYESSDGCKMSSS